MITREAADRLNRAAIGLQKRVEVDRLARQHRPKFAAFFRNQKALTLEKFAGYKFLFTESYRALREEIGIPNEFLTVHDLTRLWETVDRDTFDELQRLIASTESDGVLKGADFAKKMFVPGKGGSFDLANPRAVAWFQQNGGSLQYIKNIQDTTRDQIQTIIVKSIDQGKSYTQTAKEIADTFDGMSRDRAQRIAVNEAGNAYEQGNMIFSQSLKDDGITMVKHWNRSDEDACDECIANEDEGYIPIDQYHQSGHQQPLAHNGCRCWESYEQAPAE